MLRFDHDKARHVALNTRAALDNYDNALRAIANLTVSVIDAASETDLPASDRQRLMETMHSSAAEALHGRAEVVSMVSMLSSLQRRSNQAETDFGCPGPVPLAAAEADQAPRAALRAVA